MPAAPDPASAFSFANLSRAFRHHWVLAITAGLVLFGAFGGATWYFLPAKYTAYALLRVEEAEPQLLPDNRVVRAVQTERYFENTQVELIKSRPIILAALRREGIGDLNIVREQPDPAEWLEKALDVRFLEKTDILRLALDGKNPSELAKLVNAVKDAYMENVVNVERTRKKFQLDDLEKVCASSEDKIRGQRQVLRELAESLKSSDTKALSVKQKAILEEYAALRKELALLQAQLRSAESGLELQTNAKNASKVVVPDYLVEQLVEADVQVTQKRVEVALLDSKITQLAGTTEPKHPLRERYEKDRKALAEELERLKASRRDVAKKQIGDKMRTELEAKKDQTKENLLIWRRQEVLLRVEVERVEKEAKSFGITSFELELKRSEIEQAEAVIRRIREEKERLQVELQSTKQRVTVHYAAEPPNRENLVAQIRVVGFAGFGGLLLGVFGVSYWGARGRRLMTEDEIRNEVGCRVLGVLPWVEPKAKGGRDSGRLDKDMDPVALLSDSVDGIRAQLMWEEEKRVVGRVLMVTSAVAREGKTTLACHLALSLAAAGRKTLLLDCDFRRPELHHVFDIPRGPGLTEVLRGAVCFEGAIRPGPAAGLWLLAAGENSREISHAQVMNEMRGLLEDLRKQYDFVVIDCSPVLPVADALYLGRRVDGVLLSVQPRLSQVPLVNAAFGRLAALRIPVLGAVVNGVRGRSNSYEYRYGYAAESKD